MKRSDSIKRLGTQVGHFGQANEGVILDSGLRVYVLVDARPNLIMRANSELTHQNLRHCHTNVGALQSGLNRGAYQTGPRKSSNFRITRTYLSF